MKNAAWYNGISKLLLSSAVDLSKMLGLTLTVKVQVLRIIQHNLVVDPSFSPIVSASPRHDSTRMNRQGTSAFLAAYLLLG